MTTIKWGKFDDAYRLSEEEYRELMAEYSKSHAKCTEWRNLVCATVQGAQEGEPNCSFNMKAIEAVRDAVYDKSVFDRRRFGCDNKRKIKVAVLVTSRDSILFVKSYGGNWSLPKGSLEEDEMPIDGARRELREETGITRAKLMLVGDRFKIRDTDVYLYHCHITDEESVFTEASLNKIDYEISELAWIPRDSLKDLEFNYFTRMTLRKVGKL